MNELLAATAPFLPATLVPVLLLLLAPTATARQRIVFAAALLMYGVVVVVLGLVGAEATAELAVINPFINLEAGEPIPFEVEQVRAPGWVWPIVAGGFLWLAAAWIWLRRGRVSVCPHPVGFALGLTVTTLAARLVLEKAAAPEPLTWAIGMSVPMILVLPFVGHWVGRRSGEWRVLVQTLLVLGLLQRSVLVLIGLAATGLGLGTHLDVRAIEEVTLPLGHHDFRGPGDPWLAQWFWLLFVPQMALWVVATVVGGLALGALPFLRARRGRC